MTRWKFLLLATTCVAALAPSARGAPLDEVMQADRAFAAAAVKDGPRAAFLAFAAPDAMMFQPGIGPVKGHAAIGATFGTGEEPLPDWGPEGGEVAASGDLAYTWGYFTWSARDGSGKKTTGNYVSIWRRIGGQWKWIVDLGVPAPPKAK